MTQNDNVSIYLGKGKHLIQRKGNILSNMIPRKHRLESQSIPYFGFLFKSQRTKIGVWSFVVDTTDVMDTENFDPLVVK